MSDWTFGAGATWPTRAEEDALTARQRARTGNSGGIAVVARSNGYQAWSRGTMADILRSVALAIEGPLSAVPDNPSRRAYVAGMKTTLRAVCAAFGLDYWTTSGGS